MVVVGRLDVYSVSSIIMAGSTGGGGCMMSLKCTEWDGRTRSAVAGSMTQPSTGGGAVAASTGGAGNAKFIL